MAYQMQAEQVIITLLSKYLEAIVRAQAHSELSPASPLSTFLLFEHLPLHTSFVLSLAICTRHPTITAQ